ncbi:PTS system mannose/fructose/sorbose family transporter subunit IID [Parafannyhessea umbonata]|uniref:PTS system IID component, Man family n=1 Tax=Parafannyhessea umbonata TaxID=604330 RepID=A0A1H9P8H6_9ACTN|nr:PTS system mannose/fructose/sorbose family transporter subunit IID [Parafannyhessea umbonata]SER44195.1 PTS system IID component, Man family [Parafannyhessea umbonata]
MSSFFKPKDFKDFNEAPSPVQLPDGSYEPVLTKEDLKVCSRRMWLMDTVSYSYATQNAPCAAFAAYYALRKIYGNDEDAFNKAMLNQLDCVFNATPPVCGLVLGAGLAIEDKQHEAGMQAENDLKVGLMGPISGIGDVFIWILPMTILGSIAGYMAMQGSPVGILLWVALWMAVLGWRLQNYNQGYGAGASVITKLGDKVSTMTDAASILGLTVVGSLIFSAISIYTPLTFTYGEISLALQVGVLDQIFPNLLAVLTACGVYKLIKKGVKLNWIIFGIIVICWACAAFGILGVAPAA